MGRIVEYSTPNGPVFVEIAGAPGATNGVRKAGISDSTKNYVEKASTSFESALSNAFLAATAFVESASKLKVQPQELNIEFGLKLSGEVDFFVVTANTEANFVIKMKWKRDGRAPS
jgi:inner membrane protein involved in colicin E2 resistance